MTNRATKTDSIVDLIGGTPCVRFRTDEAPGARFWIKLEGCNPSGSIKDRACMSNIRDAERTGRLKPGMTLLDASSGNMACALAFYGRILGYGVKVVCGSKLTEDKANFIRYFGADLESVGMFTIDANRYCQTLMQAGNSEQYCFLDQLHNWANPKGNYETLGPEILESFPELAAVVGSLGSGGSMYGVGSFLKERHPAALVVAVQAASGTKLPGVGGFDDGDYVTPFIAKGYSDKLFDRTHKIGLDRAVVRTGQMRDQGIFVGFQTGGVLDAAIAIATNEGVSGDVVVLSGDTGWKNMEKLLAI